MGQPQFLHIGSVRDVAAFKHYLHEHRIAIPCDEEMLSGSASSLLIMVLVSPALEELVFRAGVQDALERRFGDGRARIGPISAGNVATSVLFAAAHLMVAPSWLAAATFVPSLVFGHAKTVYRTLWPAILLHAWYNGCYVAGTSGAAIRLLG